MHVCLCVYQCVNYSYRCQVMTPHLLLLLPSSYPSRLLPSRPGWLYCCSKVHACAKLNFWSRCSNQLSVSSEFHSEFSELTTDGKFSWSIYQRSVPSAINKTLAAAVTHTGSLWAEITQRRMLGCHPLLTLGDRPSSVQPLSFTGIPPW